MLEFHKSISEFMRVGISREDALYLVAYNQAERHHTEMMAALERIENPPREITGYFTA